MNKPKLTYFDAPTSRGEECRLALYVAGVDFDDNRLKREDWPALKPTTPFGSVPVLEMPGQPALGQSNAILRLIGRLYDLHPKDPFEAARHDAMMEHVEDMRHGVAPSLFIADAAEKKAAREKLASGFLPSWAQHAEQQLSSAGPFFAGAQLHVVDLKLYLGVRWFKSGALDHVPTTVFDRFPRLLAVHDAVREHARVKAWYAR